MKTFKRIRRGLLEWIQASWVEEKGGKMVPNCVPVDEVSQDKEIKDRDGSQPKKYYAKDADGDNMAKSTKQARARHFDKRRRAQLQAMHQQRPNYLNTQRNMTRCSEKHRLRD